MKHLGELAIIGALLKPVKTSCVHTMQGHTYLVTHRLFLFALVAHILHNTVARVAELQLNIEW